MRIGHTIIHRPTRRKGVCKGLPRRQQQGSVWVRVAFGESVEMVKAVECRVICGRN